MYVSGWLDSVGGVFVNGTARWDGVKWDSVGGGGAGQDMHAYSNELYAAGFFQFENGVGSKIAKWNGIKWDSIGTPSNYSNTWTSFGPISALSDYNGDLFFGGPIVSGFTPENVPKEGVMRWNGITWEGLAPHGVHNGSSCLEHVRSFENYNGDLYIGGCFKKGDNTTWPNIENYIVKWDGDSLRDVGGGTNGEIYDIVVFNNELYVVGNFNTAGGVPAEYIAKWNGTEWCGLGSQFNGDIGSIEVHNGELYIGGAFTDIDGYSFSRVAKWIGGNYTDTCGVQISTKEAVLSTDTEISIYPNPTMGQIIITGLSEEPVKVSVYNLLGELIYEAKLTGKQIDVSHLSSSIYFLYITQGETVGKKKIIKL